MRYFFKLANGLSADVHISPPEGTCTTCEIWRRDQWIATTTVWRHPRDCHNESIALTVCLARALMMFYGRPSLFSHLHGIHGQLGPVEYRMLLSHLSEEVDKRRKQSNKRKPS